jgi:hypothetical protein
MSKYSFEFNEILNNGDNILVCLKINTIANEPIRAKNILVQYIIKVSRFGIPKIILTPKGNTIISHSNDERANDMPFVNIDYEILQKIQSTQPKTVFKFNHLASPFIPISST